MKRDFSESLTIVAVVSRVFVDANGEGIKIVIIKMMECVKVIKKSSTFKVSQMSSKLLIIDF